MRKRSDTDARIRKQFSEYLNKQFIEIMRGRGRPLTVGEFAEYLGEERTKVGKWLSGDNIPSGEALLNLSNYFGLEVYDIAEQPRPNIVVEIFIDQLLSQLPELKERNPALFNELLQRIKDLDNEPAPSPQSYPRAAENGV